LFPEWNRSNNIYLFLARNRIAGDIVVRRDGPSEPERQLSAPAGGAFASDLPKIELRFDGGGEFGGGKGGEGGSFGHNFSDGFTQGNFFHLF